jgi:putative ABC transport system ATP-binding protein
MRTMQREFEISFIFSSHDPQVLAAADDSVFVQDGAIVSTDQRNESQESAA